MKKIVLGISVLIFIMITSTTPFADSSLMDYTITNCIYDNEELTINIKAESHAMTFCAYCQVTLDGEPVGDNLTIDLEAGSIETTIKVGTLSKGDHIISLKGISDDEITGEHMENVWFLNAMSFEFVTDDSQVSVTPYTLVIQDSSSDNHLTNSNFTASTDTYFTDADITITPSTSDLSFTVKCTKACVAAIENSDGTYTRLTGTAEGEAYKFTANSADDKIVVAMKGDVSGDGAIDSDDYGPLVAKYLETGTLNSLQSLIGDINADGIIDSDDYGPLVAAYLETGTISW
jgi:hypothetical protein